MPWFQKDDPDTPAEVKDLTPEQIIAKIKEADTLKTQLDTSNATLQTRDGELATSRQRLTELEGSRRQPDEPPSIWADPEKAIGNMMAPTTAIAIHAGKIAARMSAQQSMTRENALIFRKYEAEIMKMVEGYPPAQQIMPEAYHFALNNVKGSHLDEIMKAKNENSDFFSEVPGNNPPPPITKKDELSAKELEICGRMNITPERYLAQKKAMEVVNA